MGLSRRDFLTAAAGGAGFTLLHPALSLARPTDDGRTFPSGVASGDPSDDGVVLWTRVAAGDLGALLRWEVFPLADPTTVVARGTARAEADADGTVQVPVDGLEAGTAYGYWFRLRDEVIEGRTRTLPADPDHLRVGVVSCSKYSDGYYNAYRALAAMDCDVVLHLGDYLYASPTRPYDDPLGRWQYVPGREHVPDRQTRTLEEYRTRYRQYRSDPDLQLLHASVPMVVVWDDNDIANNAYRDGNQAGEPPEVWYPRKAAAQRAWREYHPTRVGAADADGNLQIWRRLRAGDLLDLVMLDTRLQRDRQVSNAAARSTAENDDPDRTMLGPTQLGWFEDHLAGTRAAWTFVGQGVVMAHWRVVGGPEHVGRLRNEVDLVRDHELSRRMADGGVYWNSDGWDGYTAERGHLFERFGATGSDVVVLTGDVHSSWANELVPDADPLNEPVGVEFVTPATSTRPFASNVYGATPPFEAMFTAANPWIKYCDMDANGFLVVDLDHERALARWFQVDTRTPGAPARPLTAWVTHRGSNRVLPHLDPGG